MISAVLHASLMPLLSYIWMARPVATNNIKVQVRVGFRVLAMPFICTSCAAPVTRCKILLYILLQKKFISWKAYCPLIALYIFSLFNILDGWLDAQLNGVQGCVFGGLLIFFRLNIRSLWAAKLTFWKLERGQRLCWCDSGLWGWSAGGSSQGDLGWEGTLLLIISQSSSHQGHCWEAGKRQQLGVMVKPAGPRIAQILFLSGCWAAGIELSGYWAAGFELSSIFSLGCWSSIK